MEGTRIGSYRLTRKLGEGGMGAVYLAESESLSTRKAVKVLLTELSADPAMMARFRNEAQAVAALEHDNIIGIDEFTQLPNGQWFIMMPFLEGAPLSSFLASHGPLTIHLALHILAQVGAALHAAHTRGFVHRDLKPENIFITWRPTNPHLVKLLDFGIAKNTRSAPDGTRTQNGAVLGTPVFMAGEQYEDAGRVDARADIFSLGVLAYMMLSGGYPFGPPTENWMALYHRQRHESPAPLPDRVPVRVQQLIYAALAFIPAARPQSAQAFILEYAQGTPDDHVEPHGIEIVRRVAAELLTAGPYVETTQNRNAEPSRAPWPGVVATPMPAVGDAGSSGIPLAEGARSAPGALATAGARPARAAANPRAPQTARSATHEPNAYPAMSSPAQLTTLSAASGPIAGPAPTAPRGSRARIGAVGAGFLAVAVVVVVLATKRGGGGEPRQGAASSALTDARAVHVALVFDAAPVRPTLPPPAVDAVARATMRSIVIATVPEGADVTVDGKPAGASPVTISRRVGATVEIRAEQDGFRTATQTVVVEESSSRVDLRLVAKAKSRTSSPPSTIKAKAPDAAPRRPGFNPDDVEGD